MKQLILFTLFYVGVSSISFGSELPPETTWTLQDLLKYAVENSPVVIRARQEKQQALLEEDKAKSLYWPRLKLSTSHGFRNQNPAPYDPIETSSSTLTLSENLWNKGIDSKKIESARLSRRKAELQFFQKRDETCLGITQEYYRYSQLVKSLEIQKNQQKLLKKQFDLVSDEYLHGLRSRRDFLRFKSQAQRAELDLQKQVTLIEKSRLTLLALAGIPNPESNHQFQPELSPPPLLDLFKNPAELNNTYEDQLLTLNEQIAELNEQVSLKQLTPTLSFDLNGTYGSSDYWNTGATFKDKEKQSWSALFTFNWTLWDGGETRISEALVHLQTDLQKTDLKQKKLQLQSEVLKLQKQFLQLKENFKSSEEFLILEQNNFLFLEGEYRQSKTTYLDFINGVKDLSEAQNRHWSNLFDLKQGIVLYHYYKGSLFRYLLNDYSSADEATSEE